MELLYRFEASLTETFPVGLVLQGVRLDVHFDGHATAGLLAGARIRGIDYLLLRGDGVGVLDVYETLEAGEGRVVSAHAQGYIVPPADLKHTSNAQPHALAPDTPYARLIWPGKRPHKHCDGRDHKGGPHEDAH